MMTLEESVVMLIRDTFLHTYFTCKDLFCSEVGKCYPYLMQNGELKDIDEKHSRLVMHFSNTDVVCRITWKHSTIQELNGFVLHEINAET